MASSSSCDGACPSARARARSTMRGRAGAVASIACLVLLGATAAAPARTTPGAGGKLDSRVQEIVASQQRSANVQAAGATRA